ncbi:MAG: NrdH-redoxin [Candidatus Andersenbacteria bacterium RIFCSPHIGHO2_12_FULL_46_9]|nr:MAG: Glutaredoxin [Parcubacteria group bacterium GW2011_GWA2_45_14]OGY35467.1 MAG: NrdH-redoxin [Candidatus Andersenbacteria bacterium RIFCSPHIGHO2_02_FULL_46_16]OGY36881.1 MAG: NrdH-redoxin [Candidatus Andersenbacteria bacterium RIFCSPLOWO2_02_FULL_46_11]OGY38387.1 MAG: NrdH-redoxin [Candidatus Andersenbacteria bacterium RIFCSPHIGHO2_12_FULL_46_9]HBE90616.1 NrdH-redoxin [Candidatus Andersenbacteria bacterium]
MPNVVIYTTPTCGYCHLAKAYFAENNIAYEEKNVATDLVAREEMMKKTQQSGVPVINIDGDSVIGFDQQKIAQLLGI